MKIIFLAIGAAFGAIARFLLSLLFAKLKLNLSIPVSMVLVNWIGSFGLGVFLSEYFAKDSVIYVTVAIGFFGALTTFSTFSIEAVTLIRNSRFIESILYIIITIIGSLLVFLVGFSLV